MKRCTLLILTVSLCACPAFCDAAGNAVNPPRAAIALAYRQMDAAATQKNAAARMALCDAGFSRFPAQGKLYAFAEEQKRLSRTFSVLRTVRITTRIGRVSVAPDGATVEAKEVTAGKLSVPSEHPNAPLRVTRQVRDFWVKSPTGWKLKRRRVLSLSASVNGVPVKSNLPLR